MSGKTKSTKLLGLQIQDLLASCYAPNARGTIRRSEYQMFWLQVNNKREATEFLLDVLTKLVACLDKSVQQTPIDLQSLANTIHFITLFIDFNAADPRLKKILEQWQKQEKVGDFGRKFPSAKEVIRTLTMRVEGAQDMLGHIVIGCHTLHSVEEFKKVSDPVGSATFTDGDIQSGESVFLYPYLQAAAHQPDQLANLLVTTAQKTLTLQQQLKLNPKVAESTLLALLHMIKSFISALPVTDQSLLKKVSSILQQFYLWPNPFGSFARDTLLALKNEMLVPGANLLVKALADSRTAAVKGMDDALGQPARALYYFIEEEDEMAISLVQTMELPALEPQMDKLFPEKVASAGLAPMQQLSFMLNLLKSDSGLSEAEVNQFRALSAAQIDSLYHQMTEFITLGNGTGKPQTAKDIRAQGWFEIKSRLAQLAAMGEPAYPWPENAKPLLDGAAPVLSPLAHLGVTVPTQAEYKFSSRQEVEDLIRSFPGEDVDALYLSAAVPNTPIHKRLENLLHAYQVDGDKQVDVRIVLAGGNDLLHSFLCAYTNLALSRPQLFHGLRLKFYIVPFARNFVASYLGRHDSWYNRHIYTPFRSPGFLLPWIRVEKDSIEESSGELFPPGRFFRGLVESYVREATDSCDMNLYICEGWLNAPTPDGTDHKNADQLIPFLQRLEIGLVPDAREYQKKKGWPADMKFEEIVKDNRFLFNPPEVKVQFKPVDLKGRPQIVIRDGVKQDFVLDEGASYTSILVSNVPRKGDRCFPPKPTDPWLELHAQPSEAARAKQKLRKNVLMGDPRQHINELTISCLRPDENILVRLDGKNFGPFHHLTVKPLRAADGNAIKFPVQTYFPFDL